MSDEPMRRTPGVKYEPDNQRDVHDFIVDYSRDAIDAGVHPSQVITALEKATNEMLEAQQNGEFRDEAKRSEPADFGGGESTGVQDL